MTNRPRGSQPPTQRPQTRRQVAAQSREASLQRRVVLVLAGVVALALGLVIAGLVWEQVIQPRQTIKQVGNETLTRREYDQLTRQQAIQQIVQNVQFVRFFGPGQSFGQGSGSFDEQVLQANAQLADLGTARSLREPVSDAQVEQWVNRQLLEQGAQEQFNTDPSQGEIDQLLVSNLGFLLETEAPTDTDTLTDTDTFTGTDALTETDGVTETEATETPPSPTPTVEEATAQANQIIDTLYSEYTTIINQFAASTVGGTAAQRTPNMDRDELAETMRLQFREQLLRQQVSEQLVPSLPEDETAEEEFIQVRQILLQVPPPDEAQTDLPETDGITGTDTLTPTDELTATETLTPTDEITGTDSVTDTQELTPEQLEQLFAERRAEAEDLYQQLQENPDRFEQIARDHSEDPQTATQGGEVGLIDRQGTLQEGGTALPQPVIEAAWALPDNGISEPVRTDNGWVIVQRLPEDPEDRLQRLRQDALTDWIEERRAQTEIIPPPSPTPTTVVEPTPFATEPAEEQAPGENATPAAEE